MVNGARSAPVWSDNVEIDATASPRGVGVGVDACLRHLASTPMTLGCQEKILAENWNFIQFSGAAA